MSESKLIVEADVSVKVNSLVYDLAKPGTINCLLFPVNSDQANLFEQSLGPNHVAIINQDNTKKRIIRRVERLDVVKAGYRGRGYPGSMRTTQDSIRVMIDMVVDNHESDESE